MPERGDVTISGATLRRLAVALFALAFFALVVFGAATQREALSALLGRGLGAQIDKTAYQAVFLTGGQVYFGRLQSQDDYFLLSDVFYIGDATEAPSQGTTGQLVKRGDELHAPKEPMLIPRDKVLFVENMRDDSQVVTAIRQFRSGQTPARPSPTAGR